MDSVQREHQTIRTMHTSVVICGLQYVQLWKRNVKNYWLFCTLKTLLHKMYIWSMSAKEEIAYCKGSNTTSFFGNFRNFESISVFLEFWLVVISIRHKDPYRQSCGQTSSRN